MPCEGSAACSYVIKAVLFLTTTEEAGTGGRAVASNAGPNSAASWRTSGISRRLMTGSVAPVVTCALVPRRPLPAIIVTGELRAGDESLAATLEGSGEHEVTDSGPAHPQRPLRRASAPALGDRVEHTASSGMLPVHAATVRFVCCRST